MKKIKVLIVDDMALVREILATGLAKDPDIEIVGTASDPYIAAKKIEELEPDVLTLDVEMPRMDGVEFLRKLMPQYPLPVVMVSSLTERGKQITLDALAAGAVDFVHKPSSNIDRGLNAMMMELRTKIKIASIANVSQWKHTQNTAPPLPASQSKALDRSTDKIVVIGASTGGTEAINAIIPRFPAIMPGIVIVQHMPAGFTRMFADRLNQFALMEVKEAADGDRIVSGKVLIAPGGKQMRIIRSGGIYQVSINEEGPVNGHCPSVEVLMQSAAKYVGKNAVGIMLTGMGGDGADGLKAMRDAGARTMAQNEATCVVFGMPKVAWEKGGAEKLVPLNDIPQSTIRYLEEME